MLQNVSYLDYLGPDWKPEFDRPCTVISNHISIVDIFMAIYYVFPVFVAAEAVKLIPGIRIICDVLNTIYITRVGKDSTASKKLVFQQIREH